MRRALWRGLWALGLVVSVTVPAVRAEPDRVSDYVALRLVGAMSALDDISDNGDPGSLVIQNDEDVVAAAGIAIGTDWLARGLKLRTELEYTYRHRVDFDTRINGGNDAGFSNNLSTHSVLINVFRDFDLGRGGRPYVGAGIGWAINVSDTDQTTNNINFCCSESREDSKSNFAWSVQAGVVYDLGHDWRLGLGYRYMDLGEVQSGRFGDGLLLTADDYTSHDILFSVVHRFYESGRRRRN